MIVLQNQRAVVIGKQGSGKTELCRHILRSTQQHLVYDRTGHDYAGFIRYLPDDPQSVMEMNAVVQEHVINASPRPRLFVLDEGNAFIRPKPSRLPPAIAELNDLSRHMQLSWVVATRRPSQFHSDIMELADYIFVFRLPGPKDRVALNDIAPNLGDIAADLPPYHFVVYDSNAGSTTYHAPIDTRQADSIVS